MWPYWLMFAAAWLGALAAGESKANRASLAWLAAGLCLVWLIGARNSVGGDWYQYQYNLDALRGLNVTEALEYGDPAYQFLSWLFADFEYGVMLVNTTCALIFTFGLVTFCRSLPRPWLALGAAIPYFVIVVAMGYTRQSVALGCWMLGLVALSRGSSMKFAAWVLLGALFHKSALVLLPLPLLVNRQNRLISAIAVCAVFALGYVSLLQDSVDRLYTNYVEAQYQSEGAYVRLLMCVVPAVVLLARGKRLTLPGSAGQIWRWLSILAIVLLIALFVSPSSTAVDRLALYLLPLQLVVFAHLPDTFPVRSGARRGAVLAALLYFFAVQFVWLNFATHSIAWLPYTVFPFSELD
jgi:hypothetical protein